MKKDVCTLLCAALVGLAGSSSLFASTPITSPKKLSAPIASPTVATPAPTKATRSQSMVQVTIALPYLGQDNYWEITFLDTSGGGAYTFCTNDNTFQTGVLGDIPEGNYNVTFNQTHGRHSSFEFYVGCDQTRIRSGTYDTLYNRTVDSDCSNVIIDCMDSIF